MKNFTYSIRKFIYKYPGLFFIFLVTTISSILIQLPLSAIDEFFVYGAELGKFFYDLAIGYIISYIFFYLVVFKKEENDKRHVNNRISATSSLIILDGYEIFCRLIANNDKFNRSNHTFPPTLDQLKTICINTDPFNTHSSTNNTKDRHWFIPLKYKKKETTDNLKKLFQLLPYLDSELVGILTKIEDTQYFKTLDFMIIPHLKPSENENFEFISESMYTYFDLLKQLENYCSKNLNDFSTHKQFIKSRINIYQFAQHMVT